MNKKLKISVCSLCYNHGMYIRQSLDSMVGQKHDYDYEIIVHDDASTDESRSIIEEYAVAYPDVFKPILQDENQYSKHVDIDAQFILPAMTGDFAAFCECDDYWIDNEKLKRQADFLRDNPDVGMVYGRVRYYNEDEHRFAGYFGGPYTEFEDLFFQSTIPTATVMVRADLYRKFYDEVRPHAQDWAMGDYPMWLWFALNSKIAFQPEVTAVYRVLAESASHSRSLSRLYQFRLKSNPVSEYFIERYGERFTPEFIHRARSQRHEMTLPMAIRMKDWATVDKIREYYAQAAAQGHATPAAMARMLAHPRLSRHLINGRIFLSSIKNILMNQ